MSSHQTDRHHFERQIVYARPIFILLALLAVLEQPPSRGSTPFRFFSNCLSDRRASRYAD